MPSYKTDQLPGRYIEALLKKSELSIKENERYEKIKLKLSRSDFDYPSLCLLIYSLTLKHNRISPKLNSTFVG